MREVGVQGRRRDACHLMLVMEDGRKHHGPILFSHLLPL